jgi:nicotinate-nucleotide adenylyltransferase
MGGTFDPIHYGHLDAATAARTELALDEVWLLPSHDPPHRPADPLASPFHRFALVALAASGCAGLTACDIELRRDGPSYTVATLQELHRLGWPPAHIFFIIGADAFGDIAAWRAFPAVLEAANFAVVGRAGMAPEHIIPRVPDVAARLVPMGYQAQDERDTNIFAVAGRTRDISSSLIRERLQRGNRIDDLVPAAVERHIMANRLYGSVGPLHAEQ